ncbi:phosphonate C-P lyase system protein PhnH [Paraburkholderia ginsengiterrae]|uniref:Phosphonate C-P lyase system protein PhnH n=1 Tax=Paraburkholderia ginsengiterrae TaxID=1462993 RepID=A0A1A9N2G1_9BURK|nr:phosphonate C-P lyase system protein PhnH [Paraburkholderia ginsengiterrae]OAJ53030.1 phosphonate C-P lyase system protein PhnH [Paraburkholderia ginsengiterrae]OAJ55726.1 phosphonate C-P lyase system protein PhnH [Paraburkholderia ginsengiterrae]
MENSPIALSTLTPGFSDPVHDTQAVFRTLLDALSRPGTVGVVEDVLPEARADHAELAAFAALLTLCDYATPVWLAQADTALSSALRFHTGAPLVDELGQAAFAYIHDAGALPPLESFAPGTAESPEQSVTLLIRVDALTGGAPVVLSGPGIQHTATIAPVGLPERFWHERAALAPLFPCGIDCYLVCGNRLIGLPRTTQAKVN